jgi:hypothetical protein
MTDHMVLWKNAEMAYFNSLRIYVEALYVKKYITFHSQEPTQVSFL